MKNSPAGAILRNSWLILAMVVIIALVIAVNWYYFIRIRAGLDREFSIRLESLASLVSVSLASSGLSQTPEGSAGIERADSILSVLAGYEGDFELSDISIIREDGVILLSLHPGLFPPGETYPLWNMDYEAIIRALDGNPSSTVLTRAQEGGFFKAGYAPFPPGLEKAWAVAAVEADAAFLRGLHDQRNMLTIATVISLSGLIFFVIFVLKATASLVRTRESLLRAETLSTMGRMAAGIAHEIRNPLFIIRSSAERLIAKHPEDKAEIDDFIIDEADRLNGILTDYLLFARDGSAPRQKSDLAVILRRCAKLVGESGKTGCPPIETSFSIEQAPLVCEEKRLQQVFLNILINACQSGQSGGSVMIDLRKKGGDYLATVSDRGKGIPKRDIEKVFEPFYSTSRSGSGLGLAIARSIVEEHGGTISIESDSGAGTSVRVAIPAVDEIPGGKDEQNTDNR